MLAEAWSGSRRMGVACSDPAIGARTWVSSERQFLLPREDAGDDSVAPRSQERGLVGEDVDTDIELNR